jgi:hypothetical protein
MTTNPGWRAAPARATPVLKSLPLGRTALRRGDSSVIPSPWRQFGDHRAGDLRTDGRRGDRTGVANHEVRVVRPNESCISDFAPTLVMPASGVARRGVPHLKSAVPGKRTFTRRSRSVSFTAQYQSMFPERRCEKYKCSVPVHHLDLRRLDGAQRIESGFKSSRIPWGVSM